jgi:hypothetical protein
MENGLICDPPPPKGGSKIGDFEDIRDNDLSKGEGKELQERFSNPRLRS